MLGYRLAVNPSIVFYRELDDQAGKKESKNTGLYLQTSGYGLRGESASGRVTFFST